MHLPTSFSYGNNKPFWTSKRSSFEQLKIHRAGLLYGVPRLTYGVPEFPNGGIPASQFLIVRKTVFTILEKVDCFHLKKKWANASQNRDLSIQFSNEFL